MRRKNFILTILLFLFINILSFSNEKLPSINTSINSINPIYDESLKEYKIKAENIDLFYNYIQKKIDERGFATTYTKLEKDNLVATDENNNIIFAEKLPENLSQITTYFESKQIYKVKNRKILINSDYVLESDGEKIRGMSETLLNKNINGKNIFEIIDLTGDLNISSEIIFSKVENYKSKIYDKNENLIFSTTYINRKLEAESQVDETLVKMTYNFDDNNFNKGTVNLYMNNKLFATVRIKNSIQDLVMKIFYKNFKFILSLNFINCFLILFS